MTDATAAAAAAAAEEPSNKRARPDTQAGEESGDAPRTPRTDRKIVKAKRSGATATPAYQCGTPPPPRGQYLYAPGLEKEIARAKSFTVVNGTGEETIRAADPREALTMIDPAQSMLEERYKKGGLKSDNAFVRQMANERVSS